MLLLLGVTLLLTPYGPFAVSTGWAVPMLLCSVVLYGATVRSSERKARLALLLTVALGSAWFGGFVAEAVLSSQVSPASLIAWGGILVIDLIMIRRPLTTPFEELLTTE